MIRPVPPISLQHLVFALLSPRDQETISGDLLEAYADRRRANGPLSANLWYMRQAASFVPRAAFAAYRATPGLVFLCCFTAACGVWLGTMDMLLHHHNLVRHEGISALIVGQAMLTLLTLPLRRLTWLRWIAALGAAAITWLGGSVLIALMRGETDFEGYILIIAAMLVVQAALTWRAMLRRNPVVAVR